MTATTTTRTLEITGMSGSTCVQKVTEALKKVPGVTTQNVKVGGASITCDDDAKCQAACAAIKVAGYEARETEGSSDLDHSTPTIPLAAKNNETFGAQAAKPAEKPAPNGAAGTNGSGNSKGEHPAVTVPAKAGGIPAPVAAPAKI